MSSQLQLPKSPGSNLPHATGLGFSGRNVEFYRLFTRQSRLIYARTDCYTQTEKRITAYSKSYAFANVIAAKSFRRSEEETSTSAHKAVKSNMIHGGILQSQHFTGINNPRAVQKPNDPLG